LDHEHHETSEHHETARADMQQVISRLAGNIACGSMVLFSLVHKTLAQRANVL
jgi:hypothetical protein